MPKAPAKQFEVLLYGATGFTGQLTAAYLDGHPELGQTAGRGWAIAGRTEEKLARLKASLASGPRVVCCDLGDAAAVKEMVAGARVVLNCAGPYSAHNGEALLGECARQGVHYSDLAGEGFWQREMIEKFHTTAEASGAKVVLGGGVDSIPSDLAVRLALETLRPAEGAAVSLRGVYTEYSGSFSGGTLASGRAARAALKSGRLTKAMETDPYLLAPGIAGGADADTGTSSGMPAGFKRACSARYGLLMDFFMAPINARVVRRSLALQGLAQSCSYSECCTLAMWLRALGVYLSRGFGYPLGQPINWKPKSGEGSHRR